MEKNVSLIGKKWKMYDYSLELNKNDIQSKKIILAPHVKYFH